ARRSRFEEPLADDGPRVPADRARRLLARMMLLAKPEWRGLAIGIACLAIASASNLVFPQAIKMLVDGALTGGARAAIDKAALFLLVVGVISALAGATRFFLFTVAGERVVARLRADVYARLLDQEIAFFDERKTGDLSNRLASDTTVLQNAVS